MARPSKRSPELEEELFRRLSQGEPMAKICADEHMPDFSTVWRWEEQDDEFRKLSARARDLGTHFMADDCIRIADDPTIDTADKRVRIDTRLRLIGKWNAKNYGDKTTTELTGPNGGPIQTEDTGQLASLPKAKRDAVRAAIKAAMENNDG